MKIYNYGIDWEQTKTERGFLTYNETHWTVDSSYRGSEKLNEENCPRSFTLNVRVDPTLQVEDARKQVADTFNELWDVISNAQRSLQKGKSLKPLRPQWDVYGKYLQVYDLRMQYPEMEWSEIAKRIFPDEVEKDRKPVHRKIRKTELPFKTAIDKVRHYWREADRMINKEGWKQI